MITLELTTEEAESFKIFREHQDFFEILIHNEVHLLSNGSATLNFSPLGKISTVVLNQVVYRK